MNPNSSGRTGRSWASPDRATNETARLPKGSRAAGACRNLPSSWLRQDRPAPRHDIDSEHLIGVEAAEDELHDDGCGSQAEFTLSQITQFGHRAASLIVTGDLFVPVRPERFDLMSGEQSRSNEIRVWFNRR